MTHVQRIRNLKGAKRFIKGTEECDYMYSQFIDEQYAVDIKLASYSDTCEFMCLCKVCRYTVTYGGMYCNRCAQFIRE